MDALTCLAEPTRRRIVELLIEGEKSFGEIASNFAVSGPAVSQHLKLLRESRLVTRRTDGQRRVYRIDREGFSPVRVWLDRVVVPRQRADHAEARPEHEMLRSAFYQT
jgi:DNA-binding transcriptional ArsR family regulator